MPSKHLRHTNPSTITGGGGTTTIDPFTDSFSLNIIATDSNAGQTDADSYAITLLQSDTNDVQTEAVSLNILGNNDSNTAPTDANSFTMRVWLSASSGGTNPSNADGANDGAVASLQTSVTGTATIDMLSTLGANLPSGMTLTSVIYRGWFKSVNVLVTSTGSLILHSTSALFTDVTMFTNSALNTTVDHLSGDFTFDVLAAGINTEAKLQSIQMDHRVHDAAQGVQPHQLTVDAGCLEIVGAFV